jgi:glucosamine--fructose-6-phosphate aminotransferase (isomerizing)
VHNGIIENFAALRTGLEARGHAMASDTDTEVVAHLLGEAVERTDGDLAEAMREVCRSLEGAFTLVVVDSQQPDLVVAARRSSPLVVGCGTGENFIASDVSAFIEHTREAIELGQDQVVAITPDSVVITDFHGAPAQTTPYHVDWDAAAAEKGGYDWFMLKEIDEQPQAVADTLLGPLQRAGPAAAGRDAAVRRRAARDRQGHHRLVRDLVLLRAGGQVRHRALDADPVRGGAVERVPLPRPDPGPLDAGGGDQPVRRDHGHADGDPARRAAAGPRAGDLQHQRLDDPARVRRGDLHPRRPEVAVASTKGFLTQIVACYLLGLYLAQVRGTKYGDEIGSIVASLAEVPDGISRMLADAHHVRELAVLLQGKKSVLFLGRHVGYPIALEGALKLKEIAYLHAEGFAAGELKHGPIALVEDGTPVFVIVPPQGRDQLHDKVVSNIQEVRARGAMTIALVEDGDDSVLEVSGPHDPAAVVPR